MARFFGRATKAPVVNRRRSSVELGTGGNTSPPPDPVPPPEGVFGGGEGSYFEDFKSDFALGWGDFETKGVLWRRWGTTQEQASHDPNGNGGTGTVTMGPSHPMGYDENGVFQYGIGLMHRPGGRDAGFPNGFYEWRAKFTSTSNGVGYHIQRPQGTAWASGPCVLLWPGDDVWPGSEIDTGELWGNAENGGPDDGQFYSASHWNKRVFGENTTDEDGYTPWFPYKTPGLISDKFFWKDWFISGVFLQDDQLTYYLNGKAYATDREHIVKEFAKGGVNHLLGVMNRSWETSCILDWMRFSVRPGRT